MARPPDNEGIAELLASARMVGSNLLGSPEIRALTPDESLRVASGDATLLRSDPAALHSLRQNSHPGGNDDKWLGDEGLEWLSSPARHGNGTQNESFSADIEAKREKTSSPTSLSPAQSTDPFIDENMSSIQPLIATVMTEVRALESANRQASQSRKALTASKVASTRAQQLQSQENEKQLKKQQKMLEEQEKASKALAARVLTNQEKVYDSLSKRVQVAEQESRHWRSVVEKLVLEKERTQKDMEAWKEETTALSSKFRDEKLEMLDTLRRRFQDQVLATNEWKERASTLATTVRELESEVDHKTRAFRFADNEKLEHAAQLEAAESRLGTSKAKHSKWKSRAKALSSKMEQPTEVEAVKKEVTQAWKIVENREEDLATWRARAERSRREQASLSQELLTTRESLAKLKEQNVEYEKEVRSLTLKLEDAAEEKHFVEEEYEAKLSGMDNLRNKLSTMISDVATWKEIAEHSQKEAEELRREVALRDVDVQGASTHLQRTVKNLAANDTKLNEAMLVVADLQQKLEEKSAEFEEAKAKADSLEADAKTLRDQLEESHRNIKQTEEEMRSFRDIAQTHADRVNQVEADLAATKAQLEAEVEENLARKEDNKEESCESPTPMVDRLRERAGSPPRSPAGPNADSALPDSASVPKLLSVLVEERENSMDDISSLKRELELTKSEMRRLKTMNMNLASQVQQQSKTAGPGIDSLAFSRRPKSVPMTGRAPLNPRNPLARVQDDTMEARAMMPTKSQLPEDEDSDTTVEKTLQTLHIHRPEDLLPSEKTFKPSLARQSSMPVLRSKSLSFSWGKGGSSATKVSDAKPSGGGGLAGRFKRAFSFSGGSGPTIDTSVKSTRKSESPTSPLSQVSVAPTTIVEDDELEEEGEEGEEEEQKEIQKEEAAVEGKNIVVDESSAKAAENDDKDSVGKQGEKASTDASTHKEEKEYWW